MKILRTPDNFFSDLKDYPYKAHYTSVNTHDRSELRIHHIDEGPKDGPILLAMHGQPVWSYLYIRMIPYLTDAGIRVIAPDLPGYGKSDKPASREDYSYQRQVDWMVQWLEKNNLEHLTFFGQDWGGLIGLRMVAEKPDRFSKVSMGNTGLPYNPNVSDEIIEEVKAFRASSLRLTPFSMMKEVRKMDGGETSPALKFMYWQKWCWDTEDLPIYVDNQLVGKSPLEYAVDVLPGWHQVGYFPTDPALLPAPRSPKEKMMDNILRMGILDVYVEEGKEQEIVLNYQNLDQDVLAFQRRISAGSWIGFSLFFLLIMLISWGIA